MFFKSFATIGLIRNFNILFPHKCFQFVQIQPTFAIFHCFFSFLQLHQKLFLCPMKSIPHTSNNSISKIPC